MFGQNHLDQRLVRYIALVGQRLEPGQPRFAPRSPGPSGSERCKPTEARVNRRMSLDQNVNWKSEDPHVDLDDPLDSRNCVLKEVHPMQTANVKTYRQNLASFHQRVIDEHDPVIVTGPRDGDVVVLSLKDFESLNASLAVMRDKVTMESLRLAEVRLSGDSAPFKTMNEVFADVFEG